MQFLWETRVSGRSWILTCLYLSDSFSVISSAGYVSRMWSSSPISCNTRKQERHSSCINTCPFMNKHMHEDYEHLSVLFFWFWQTLVCSGNTSVLKFVFQWTSVCSGQLSADLTNTNRSVTGTRRNGYPIRTDRTRSASVSVVSIVLSSFFSRHRFMYVLISASLVGSGEPSHRRYRSH